MRLVWLGGMALLFAGPVLAQRTDLRLRVSVRCWEKDDDSTRFAVSAVDTVPGSTPISTDCSVKGKCKLTLPLDHVYRVEMNAPGHVPQHVILDLNGPGIRQRKWGYDTRISVELMPRIDSVDYSICERPIGKAHFNKRENQFVWDERYTHELEPYYETMENRYREVRGQER